MDAGVGRLTTVRHWSMFVSDSRPEAGGFWSRLKTLPVPKGSHTQVLVNLSCFMALTLRRARCSTWPGRPPGRRYLPTLDAVEERHVPATLTVDTAGASVGGAQLSLRHAIVAVNAGSYSGPATGQVSGTFGSNDTILFQGGMTGTLGLNNVRGPLVISR